MTPVITAIFEPNLRNCAITLVSSRGGFTYEGLRVKCINGLTREGDRIWQVLVPCWREFGQNIMVAFSLDAVQGYQKSEWSEGDE